MSIVRSKRVDINDGKFIDYSYIPSNPDIHLKKLNDYKELTNQGSFFLLNNRFNEAMDTYEKAFQLSEQLKDEYKKNESKCNIGIVKFHLGKLFDAINLIQPIYDYINKICKEESENNTIQNLCLLCKAGVNLCLCLLTRNSENNNPISIIENIINVLSNEEDLYQQLYCSHYLNYSFFKVNSLSNNPNGFWMDMKNYDNKNDSQINDDNKFLIESFNIFVATQKFEPWLNSLNILLDKMRKLNDNQGIIYELFNQQIAICLKNDINFNNNVNYNNFSNNEEVNQAKLKLTALFMTLTQINNNDMNININDNLDNIINDNNFNNQENDIITEEYVNDIIEDYKSKFLAIRKIYQILNSFEELIDGKIQDQEYYPNNNISSSKISYKKKSKYDNFNNYDNNNDYKFNFNTEYFFKLLLINNIFYYRNNIQDNKLRKDLINETKNTIDLIESKKINLGKIKLSSIDPDISDYLTSLFKSIFKTYYKNKKRNYFRRYKKNIRKMLNNPDYSKIKNNYNMKIKNFFEKRYSHIYKGENIRKINYNSIQIKEHFYQIDCGNDLFQVFSLNQSIQKAKHNYYFDEVIKIVVGFKTKNVLNKIDSLKITKEKKPFLILSLVFRNRTIDLYFKDEKSAKYWFYGLYYYFKISKRKYKICSCTNYLLFRIKSKMMKKFNKNIKTMDDYTFSSCLIKYIKGHY